MFSEIRGLKKIHKRLSTLPNARRACPHSIDSERVLSSIKKIITEHCGDILPKNIIMPTIIHYTHEEPPPKVQAVSFPSPKVLPSVLILLHSDIQKIQPNAKLLSTTVNGPHHTFPEELWCRIFSFLSTRDRASIAAACKPFQRFVTDSIYLTDPDY